MVTRSVINKERNEECVINALTSEHCSYKSSRKYIKTLFNNNKRSICGLGEGAGIVRISESLGVVFKIESHNHPTYIEPFSGSATGVGGILRDVFSMGAKIIGTMDCIFVGNIEKKINAQYLSKIVSGIGGYSNCFGVPNLGGNICIDDRYANNVLVNAMAIGVINTDEIILSSPKPNHNKILYVGMPTTGENTSGAEMSSGIVSKLGNSQDSVSAPRPYMGRLLYEFCREIAVRKVECSIQDMGAAGMSCAMFEMASKADTGIDIFYDAIPKNGIDMTFEMVLLSETQERLLMFVDEDELDVIFEIAQKHLVNISVVGETTAYHKNIRVLSKDGIMLDLPPSAIEVADSHVRADRIHMTESAIIDTKNIDLSNIVNTIFDNRYIAGRENIVLHYDNTITNAVLTCENRDASLTMVNDCLSVGATMTNHYMLAPTNPLLAGIMSVCFAYRNLSALGVSPLSVTNNLNFGDSDDSKIIGQLKDTIHGMNTACKGLDVPILSGNVSLNNYYSTGDGDISIPPTLVLGMVGIKDSIKYPDITIDSDVILVRLGYPSTSLHSTTFEYVLNGSYSGNPLVIMEHEVKLGLFMQELMNCYSLCMDCIPVTQGGAIISALKLINIWQSRFTIDMSNVNLEGLFSEIAPSYIAVVQKSDLDRLEEIADLNDIYCNEIGKLIFKANPKYDTILRTDFGNIDTDSIIKKINVPLQ